MRSRDDVHTRLAVLVLERTLTVDTELASYLEYTDLPKLGMSSKAGRASVPVGVIQETALAASSDPWL